jgi:O-antigen ligase
MTGRLQGAALGLGAAATLVLGVALPLAMAPASKSSPLLLCIAAALALGAAARSGAVKANPESFRSPAAMLTLALAALMAASILWSHDRTAAARQFVEFLVPLAAGAILVFVFPPVADRRRSLWWPLAAGATACLVAADLASGLAFRDFLGTRALSYAYNRTLVTLVVLTPPLLALAILGGRRWTLALLLPLPLAIALGESATAVLGLAIVALTLPIAWLLPRFVRLAGLGLTLAMLAASPFIGTMASRAIDGSVHKAMASAHSDDRVAIWRSFEATAQARPLLGNGFGASLNLQNAAVAREIPPERVTLLGASHPHNAFLQLWVELGAVGAALAAALFVLWYRWIGRADRRLQPYLLAWTAAISGIALVSHGAWQAWWVAAIAAGAAGFLALARELAVADTAKPL